MDSSSGAAKPEQQVTPRYGTRAHENRAATMAFRAASVSERVPCLSSCAPCPGKTLAGASPGFSRISSGTATRCTHETVQYDSHSLLDLHSCSQTGRCAGLR